MFIYPDTTPSTSGHRDTFARDAVFEEFRARDARTLDQIDFVDRAPDETPPPADEFLDWLRLVGVEAVE